MAAVAMEAAMAVEVMAAASTAAEEVAAEDGSDDGVGIHSGGQH